MAVWVFYKTEQGRAVVTEELQAILPGKDGKARLGVLLDRVSRRTELPRDTEKLSDKVRAARLTYDGQEFRVHFAHSSDGDEAILLALHAVNKKTSKAKPSDIKLSEKRLADWERRHTPAPRG